jgi:hypothetical protein
MSDAYSEYLTLLDDMEHIPLAASEASRLLPEERVVMMARIIKLVRDRVLPQSDLKKEGLEALTQGGVAAVPGHPEARQRTRDHDAIDELASVDPRDRVRVQRLLYRLYEAIVGHIGEAEMMVASVFEDERDCGTSSRWFG